ncbi:hypothetical protein Pla52o_03540 [Novipirellula galeiformis]|uniref:Uncharacterized protein n=1 Tax=Novipirellula galeiformis TaxID=2528004 RepID=A0A5C6CSU6_9BACT|nr:hypothetical protein [Novipirellula galeiformis]TWU26501.1 hypothetical protein Pla52o_03540 [Novipirellula galeiformis]
MYPNLGNLVSRATSYPENLNTGSLKTGRLNMGTRAPSEPIGFLGRLAIMESQLRFAIGNERLRLATNERTWPLVNAKDKGKSANWLNLADLGLFLTCSGAKRETIACVAVSLELVVYELTEFSLLMACRSQITHT